MVRHRLVIPPLVRPRSDATSGRTHPISRTNVASQLVVQGAPPLVGEGVYSHELPDHAVDDHLA
jgi:hypothetical protein